MGLKKVTGTKASVEWQADVPATVDPPSIVIQDSGRAIFKSLAVRLLGVTAITGKEQLDAVRAAAETLSDEGDAPWTAADAQKILNAVGSVPAPTHVTVERLAGEGSLLFRATSAGAPKARVLRYPAGRSRPELSILAAIRQEGVKVPRGMTLEVPVKLWDDVDGLTLVANFRRSQLHDSRETSRKTGEEST